MMITKGQINKLKEAYDSNKEELVKVEDYIRECGCTDDGVTDVAESFEQGYNNALEYVFELLGIENKMTVKKLKEKSDYQFDCIMTKRYKNKNDCDEWGCATVLVGDIGVEYNFCIDDGDNYSAIYKMETDDEGYIKTDYDTFIPYEIDFDNPKWKKELENAMCEALIDFFNL